jgi:secondary thiamine-phosphate synthase enzyme
MISYNVRTSQRRELVDITGLARKAVEAAGVKDGLAVVFVPHTTAGVTINENADPDVGRDLLMQLGKLAPADGDYLHTEGNSDAHLQASLMGSSVTVIVAAGRLVLGTWQGIYFCEFDGPRERQVQIEVLKK